MSSESSAAVALAHPGLDADPGHSVDTDPPMLVKIVTSVAPFPNGEEGRRLSRLLYNEELDGTSDPNAGQFTGYEGTAERLIVTAGVSDGSSSVLLTHLLVATAVSPPPDIKLTYAYDSSNPSHRPIRDVAGNHAATFPNQADAKDAAYVNRPRFNDGDSVTLSINENNADEASVGTVAATDLDGDTPTYSLAHSADVHSFAIDASTGEIKVAPGVTLNREAKASYALTALATDNEDDFGQTLDTSSAVLVSNTGRSTDDKANFRSTAREFAQNFRTGDGDYLLTHVGLSVEKWNGTFSSVEAAIWSVSDNGLPDSLLYPLTKPASGVDNAVNVFTVPAGLQARLEPETVYAFVVRNSHADGTVALVMNATHDADEDGVSASGWNIWNHFVRRKSLTDDSWVVDHVTGRDHYVVQLSVSASEYHAPDDAIAVRVDVGNVDEPPAAPTGLTVTGQTSRTLALEWTAPVEGDGPAPNGYGVRCSRAAPTRRTRRTGCTRPTPAATAPPAAVSPLCWAAWRRTRRTGWRCAPTVSTVRARGRRRWAA